MSILKRTIKYSFLRTKILIYRIYYSFKFRPLILRKDDDKKDEHVFFQIFIDKDYDLPLKIKPKLIIDGGANVGYSAMWFSHQYPKAEIIAIEPETSNFEVLKKNTENIPNIKLINAGIWNKNTFLKVEDPRLGSDAFKVKEVTSIEEYDIEAVTIEEILIKSGYDEIDILKLDIEGSEKEVFQEAYENWLNKVRIIIIELHDRFKDGCSDNFYSAIEKYNFDKYEKGENIILINRALTKRV